jgi:hypothetical protein
LKWAAEGGYGGGEMAKVNGKLKNETAEELPPPLPPTDRPGLDRYAIIQWEWGEPEYRWFEAMTGETVPRDEHAPRDSDL